MSLHIFNAYAKSIIAFSLIIGLCYCLLRVRYELWKLHRDGILDGRRGRTVPEGRTPGLTATGLRRPSSIPPTRSTR